MAKILTFFSRQALIGATLADTDLYSEVLEVPEGSQLAVQFRVHMTNDEGLAPTGVIQRCMDQRLTPTGVWSQVGTAMTVIANPPPAFEVQAISGLLRFVRAKVTAPPAGYFVVSFDGVLREKV